MIFFNNIKDMCNTYFTEHISNWWDNSRNNNVSTAKSNWEIPPLFNFDYFPATNLTLLSFDNNIWANKFNNYKYNFNYKLHTPQLGDTFNYTQKRNKISLQANLADTAKSYLGKVNSDREGNKLFSGGRAQPWCADFVSYITKETYRSKLPSSFTNFSSVSALRQWGKNNNCYQEVPKTNKAEYIAQNVKVGDIMIEKKGGKSHTGVVTKVNPDGSFETVEGNCGNKVAAQRYSANSRTLSGFISIDRCLA